MKLNNFDSYSKYDKNDKHIYIHYKLCTNVKILKSYKSLIYTNVQCTTKYILILILLLHPLQLWWPLTPPTIVGGVRVSLGEWRWLVLGWFPNHVRGRISSPLPNEHPEEETRLGPRRQQVKPLHPLSIWSAGTACHGACPAQSLVRATHGSSITIATPCAYNQILVKLILYYESCICNQLNMKRYLRIGSSLAR